MGDSLTLALRVGFSFTVVLGLMWAAARALRGKYGDRGAGTLEVLARQQVGRSATVTVVRVADRALVLGVTEQGVTLLGDPITDLTAFTAEAPQADAPSASLRADRETPSASLRADRETPSAASVHRKALDGSILSPGTWRVPLDALRERTVRRG